MTYRLLDIATDTTGPAGIRRPGIPLAIDRHPNPWPLLLPRPAPHTMRTAIVNIDTRLISTLSSPGFMSCRNTSYVLWLAILLLLTLGGSANVQALAASEPGLEDRLLKIAKDKVVILSKINHVPSRVETEVDRIMGVMDKLTTNEISKLIDEHNSEVNDSLQSVSLPENAGALRVYWESIKFGSGYDSAGMDALVQDFLRRAQARDRTLTGETCQGHRKHTQRSTTRRDDSGTQSHSGAISALDINPFSRIGRSTLARAVLCDTSRTGRGGLVRWNGDRRRIRNSYIDLIQRNKKKNPRKNYQKSSRKSCRLASSIRRHNPSGL